MSKAIQGLAEIGGAVAMGAAAFLDPALIAVPGYANAMWALAVAGTTSELGALAQRLGSNAGMSITTRQPAGLRQIVRGMQRIPGTMVYLSTTGGSKRQYNLVIVLATHPCEAIVNLYLDGRQVYWDTTSSYNQLVNNFNFGGSAMNQGYEGPNGVQYNFGGEVFCAAFQGNQTDAPTVVGGSWVGPSEINGNSPATYPGYCSALYANDPTWAPTAEGTPYLAGCTYVYLKIEADSANFPAFPEIRFTVMGKSNIYDPRISSPESPYQYTENKALHIADAIADPTWGLGDGPVSSWSADAIDQLIASANVCDEQVACDGGATSWEPETLYTVGNLYVESGTFYRVISNYTSGSTFGSTDLANTVVAGSGGLEEAQFTVHWHYDTSLPPGDVIQQLCSPNFRLSRVAGSWFIFAPYWQGPSFTFDQNSLLAAIQWTPKRSLAQLCNRVTGTYIAPNYPYNVAGDLYDSNGFYLGLTQNNFPYAFQPTNYPMYASDPLHGYSDDVYLVEDTPNSGAWSSGAPYAAGTVIIYNGFPWQANEAVPAGEAPGALDGDGNPYWSPTGNYLSQEVPQNSCLSISQAQREAKIFMMRNRQQGSGTFTMALAALQMMPIDVMQFNFAPLSWTDKNLEIVGMRLAMSQPSGESGEDVQPVLCLEVQVQESDPNVYEWDDSTEELTPYDVPAMSGGVESYIVAPPTGLIAISLLSTALVQPTGAVIPRIELEWSEPNDTYVTNGGTILIQMCAHGSGAYQTVMIVDGQTTVAFLANVTNGLAYDIRIAAVRGSGAMSVWVYALDVVVGTTVAASGLNPVAPPGTLVAQTTSATASQILVNPFTATYAGLSASCTPSPSVITGLSPQQLYYVYYEDTAFAGGTITPIATQNIDDFLYKPGYYLIGSITTPAWTASGPIYRPSNFVNLGSTNNGGQANAYDGNLSTYASIEGWIIPSSYAPTPPAGSGNGVVLYEDFPSVSTTGTQEIWANLSASDGGSTAGLWMVTCCAGGGAAAASATLNSRGAWAASTAYAVGDTFTQGGVTYLVITAYTSGASFGSTDVADTCILLASGTGNQAQFTFSAALPSGLNISGLTVLVTVYSPGGSVPASQFVQLYEVYVQ